MFNTSGFGNLVKAVEVKPFGENNVCKFTLASNQRVKKNKEYVYEATFLDVEYWTKSVEFVEAMEKGKPYYVTGELIQEHWERDGEKRSKFVLKANSLQGIGPRQDSGSKTDGVKESSGGNEDVPF
jgi:single-strand DNA-binding protein